MITDIKMRIVDLFEGKKFDDLEWIRKDGDKSELDYDLTEDLVFFMNNDDDTYRRHLFPKIASCIDKKQASKGFDHSIFTNPVKEGYKNYVKQYPVRHLPNDIEDKVLEEVCKKMYEEFCKDYEDGKYKD